MSPGNRRDRPLANLTADWQGTLADYSVDDPLRSFEDVPLCSDRSLLSMAIHESVDNRQVVVLGGTGFIGNVLAEGWPPRRPLRYLVHRSRPSWLGTARVEIRQVALDDPAAVLDALRGSEVLINLLRPDGSGWYPDTMRRLQPIFRESGIRRCIHASSIDIYAGTDATFIDEETPSRPLSPYEVEHCAAETILAAAFPETIILRLGAVFGPGGRNIVSFAKEMKHAPHWKLALRRALYGERRMHLVSVQTVCEALIQLALQGQALAMQMILITDDADPNNNFAFVQDRLAEAFGRQPLRGVPVLPARFLRLALRLRGLPGRGIQRRFSSERARKLGLRQSGFGDALCAYARYLATRAADTTA